MDDNILSTVMVIKEVLAAMNNTGKSKDDERIRQIVRDVLSETHTTTTSERDMVNNMMQLLQQNVTKQTTELHAAAEEKGQYKAKLDELNHRMDQLMKDRGSQVSGGEASGFTGRQKRLLEMLEELKIMRGTKRIQEGKPGKPSNRGGGKGGSHGGSSHRSKVAGNDHSSQDRRRQGDSGPEFGHRAGEQNMRMQHQSPQGGFSQKQPHGQFHQNDQQFQHRGQGQGSDPRSPKEQNQFTPEELHAIRALLKQPQQHQDKKAASTPLVVNPSKKEKKQEKKPEGPIGLKTASTPLVVNPSKKEKKQEKKPEGAIGLDPLSPKEQTQYTPEELYAIRALLKQPQQHQDKKTASTPLVVNPSKKEKKQEKKPEGPIGLDPHSLKEQNQYTPEEMDAIRALLKQPQQHQDKKTASTPLVVNPSKKEKKQEKKPEGPIGLDPHSPKEQNQFTLDELHAIRAMLKQRQQHQDKKAGSTPLVVNPSKKASRKKRKQEKKPEGPIGLMSDDSDSDSDSDEDIDIEIGARKSSAEDVKPASADLAATTVEKSDTGFTKMNKKKGEKSKDEAASPNKPEDLSPLELFMASGFDLSQIADLSMNEKVNDMMLIAKEDGNIVPCQPNTVGELIEFKRKYPNAQAIIVKTSE